jgi:hypothetical protein
MLQQVYLYFYNSYDVSLKHVYDQHFIDGKHMCEE